MLLFAALVPRILRAIAENLFYLSLLMAANITSPKTAQDWIERWAESATPILIEEEDYLGWTAPAAAEEATELHLRVLSKDFTWVVGEEDQVEFLAQPVPLAFLKQHLRELTADYGARAEILVVGSADCERGCAAEGNLARSRSLTLARWVAEADPRLERVGMLSVGGWKAATCEQKTDQEKRLRRRLMIFEVLGAEEAEALDKIALRDTLEAAEHLRLRPSDYCEFRLGSFSSAMAWLQN